MGTKLLKMSDTTRLGDTQTLAREEGELSVVSRESLQKDGKKIK